MRICRAEAFLIRLPLRLAVRHALAERSESLNLLVRLCDEHGAEGWGEGVPRDYVTGEVAETSFAFLARVLLPTLVGVEIEEPDQLLPAVSRLLPPSAGAQTGCCAAELALFDLAGKVFDRTAAAWFGGRLREQVRYSVVLPLLDPPQTSAFLSGARALGFAHLKIKADGERWHEALAEARGVLGGGVTIAVDANGSWGLEEAVAHLRRMERYDVSWVEQPLPRGRESELPLLAGRSAIPLMADESLTTAEEAQRLIEQRGCGLFNLRLSKLGGLAAAHGVARIAADGGVRVQVGCQVGESSLLSAAGRLLAASLPAYEALEGSYGTRLLAQDLTDEPYEFGAGGMADVQHGPGLGITVRPERLAPLVLRSETVR